MGAATTSDSACFRSLVRSETPFVLPGAFDAMSARLVERAGFKGLFVGGFSSIGARYALPDIGIAARGEISAAVRDIRGATALPMLVDGDDGYGDEKATVYTLNAYEKLGIQALFIEDQAAPKRCGHLAGKVLVPASMMQAKIRAAAANRINSTTYIVARTDARSVFGLDEALRRAELYLRSGADAAYVEAPETIAELELIGGSFPGAGMASMLEGGKTPLCRPRDLHEMGYSIVIYGTTLLLRAIKTMIAALDDLHSGQLTLVGSGVSLSEYFDIVDLASWQSMEQQGNRTDD